MLNLPTKFDNMVCVKKAGLPKIDTPVMAVNINIIIAVVGPFFLKAALKPTLFVPPAACDETLLRQVPTGLISAFLIPSKSETSEFLAIFLNSLVGQKQLNEKATGAAINTILRKDLENIRIPIPDIKTQEKVVHLYQSNKKLQKALTQKMKLINNINEVAISKLLQ